MHVAQQVGGSIGVHFLDDVGSAVGIQRTQNRHLQLGIDLLQGLGRNLFIERLKYGLALSRSKVLNNVRNIGGVKLGQTIQRDLQFDAPSGIDLDKIDELPGNHPRRNSLQQQVQRCGRHHSLQQAADGPTRSHIHRSHFEHDMAVAPLFVDINIVDPHHLAPVNVDNLLIEQVALQQQHAFTAAEGTPVCHRGGDPQSPVNQADGRNRHQAIAVAGLHHKAGDQAGILLRNQRDFAHLAGMRAGVVDHGRTNQFRKCKRRHCSQYIRCSPNLSAKLTAISD